MFKHDKLEDREEITLKKEARIPAQKSKIRSSKLQNRGSEIPNTKAATQ